MVSILLSIVFIVLGIGIWSKLPDLRDVIGKLKRKKKGEE